MSVKQTKNKGFFRTLTTALALGVMLCLPVAAQAATMTVSTVAGTGVAGFSGDGGDALQAQLFNPMDSVKDAAGNTYIADYSNYRIRKIDAATGVITTIAGTGVAGFSGDGGPATAATMGYPYGLAVAANGEVYFSDYVNHRIRKIDAATGIISTVAGNGVATYAGDGGPATSASLSYPTGLDIAANGDLYIADRNNHRIRKVSAATGIISTVAGKGLNHVYHSVPGTCTTHYYSCGWSTCSYQTCTGGYSYWTYESYPLGDGGSATNAGLYNPYDVAVGGDGSLIVADYNNARVRRVDASGIISSIDSGIYTIAVGADDAGNAYYSRWGGTGELYRWDMASNLKSVELTSSALVYVRGIDVVGSELVVANNVNHKVYSLSNNRAPTANAGVDQTAECTGNSSASVTLDGSASSDPDGDTLTYSWNWPAGSVTGVNPTASFPIGSTTVTLTVNDGKGATATDVVVITVRDTTAPVVNAGADVTVEATSTAGAVYDVSAQATATDTCCAVSTSIAPVGTYPMGATTVDVSATDCTGNTGSDSMIVTVVDTTAPVLTVPADVTAEATGAQTSVAIGNATATDIFAVTVTSDAPATFPLGTTAVTWTATDANGNVSTGTQNVTVVDTTPPTISAPADVTAEATGDLTFVVLTAPVASDAIGVTSLTNNYPTGLFPLGTTLVTWTAVDAAGNSSMISQNVTVTDTTPPVLTVPAAVAAEANAVNSTVAIGNATATDIFAVTVTSDAPATFPLGTTVVTWTAVDANGNSTTGTQSVTVADTTAPVLTVPAAVSVEANAVNSTVAIGNATATDIFAVTVASDAPATYPLGTTVVTWTATDANGNSSTGTQSVTVVDTTAPVLTVPAAVSVEASAVNSTVAIGNATATDIFAVTVTSDAPAAFPLGTTVVTWTATDASGNSSTGTQNVTVVDTTAPVLTVPAAVSVEANAVNSTVAVGAATATDIFAVTVTSDAPATFPLGTTVVTWTATDTSGNSSTGTQNVTVVDTTAPVLTVPAAVSVEANAVNSTVAVGAATATDIFAVTVTSDAPATFPLGTTVVIWTATDANGNSSTATQNVTVVDTTAPVLTVPADVTAEAAGDLTAVAIGNATATDIFAVTVTSDAPATYPLGTTVVTWTATDANGNVAMATQNVTVADTTPPVLTLPADVTAEANAVNSTVAIGNATATDIFAVTVTSDAPATFPLGTTVVTWTAVDANGNGSTGTQNVTVVDSTAPVLTVPGDVTAEANAVNSTVSIETATATDIFAVTVTSDVPATFPLGTTVVTWTATDANGNSSTGTQNVTVVDTTAPVLTVPADVAVDASAYPLSSVDFGMASATDIFAVIIANDAPAGGFPIGETTVTWTATDANGNVSTGTQIVTVDAKLASMLVKKAEVEWSEATDEFGSKYGMSEVKAKGSVELPLWMPLSAITADATLNIGLGGTQNLLNESVVFNVKNDEWRYKTKSPVGIQKLEIEWKGSEFKFKDAATSVELESEADDDLNTSLSLETKGHDVVLTVNGVAMGVSQNGVVTSSYPYDQDEDGEVTFELPFEVPPDMVISLVIDGLAQDVAVIDHMTPAQGKFELKAEVNAGSLNGTSGVQTLDLGLSLGSVAVDGNTTVNNWTKVSAKEWKLKKRK